MKTPCLCSWSTEHEINFLRRLAVTRPEVLPRLYGAYRLRSWEGTGVDGFAVRSELRRLIEGEALRSAAVRP